MSVPGVYKVETIQMETSVCEVCCHVCPVYERPHHLFWVTAPSADHYL